MNLILIKDLVSGKRREYICSEENTEKATKYFNFCFVKELINPEGNGIYRFETIIELINERMKDVEVIIVEDVEDENDAVDDGMSYEDEDIVC